MSFLIANQAVGQTQSDDALKSYMPADCMPLHGCVCYQSAALDKIAKRLHDAKECDYEREELKKYAEETQIDAWYHDATFVWGSVIVGVSLVGVLGYWVGAKSAK